MQATLADRAISWLPEFNVSDNSLAYRLSIGNNVAYNVSGLDGFTYIQPRTINLRLSGHF